TRRSSDLAWPAGETDLYADDGTELRTTSVGDVQVHVLQHVWGVSARFECGTVMVDTYAQSQLEQHQAEAEALSLAGVLMAPLDCEIGRASCRERREIVRGTR